MTNYSKLTQTWQQLHSLAPELFIPITDNESLEQVTRTLRALDHEMVGSGVSPHPLADLADVVMHRIMAYEAVHFPIADADGPDMLAFMLEQRPLTQKALAVATGLPQSTISDLVNRKRDFTAAHARKLGEYFRVDPGIFL